MTRQPGLSDYDDPRRFPPRVWQAVELTRENHFPLACLPEVGHFLQTMASTRGMERICELGTAYGVGASWIESGMRPGASLVTVELDAGRAEAARRMLAGNNAIDVITGDWSLALEHGPFDLLFSDGGPKRNPGDPDRLLGLLRPGGIVVLDDFTPGYGDDEGRRIWLESPAYLALEVTLTSTSAVILATRR